MDPIAKPCLKVTGLHIEGLKALRRVDWPADGMGWRGQVPDMVMVGGVNGSGKTTLLELVAHAAARMQNQSIAFWGRSATVNAWIDFEITSEITGTQTIRLLVGDESFVRGKATAECASYTHRPDLGVGASENGVALERLRTLLGDPSALEASGFPRVIYLPTDRRLDIPDESFKVAGDVEDRGEFFYRWRAAQEWKDSLGALLYGARWADLNAKEEGHPEKATHFESYDRAFQTFFGAAKRLTWHEGKLFVKIADTGALHPLMELSSGEKQALILAADLHRRWRPGSLVLIDEPELHFHPSWQTTLWAMLERLQQERGGQVIVTTQSTHLFGVAEPGTTVLLGKELA